MVINFYLDEDFNNEWLKISETNILLNILFEI